MNKDGEAKPGKTKCDMCNKLSTTVVGDLLLCAEHAAAKRQKQASAGDINSLKSAGIEAASKHDDRPGSAESD